MTISAVDTWQACGCGEEQIPGMLARLGFLGATGLALATLVIMIATGWALATTVWLFRRRRRPPTATEESGRGSLDGFTWTAEGTDLVHPADGQPR